MTLYEISTDPMAERGYFIPQEPASSYYRFCETCRSALDLTDRLARLKWNGGEDPGDFVSTTGAGTFVKRKIAEELCRSFAGLQINDATVVNRLEPRNTKRHQYSG